jgi:hypothetical protein
MRIKTLMVLAAMFVIAAPMMAAEGTATGGPLLPAALAMGLASGLCGLGQGRAIGSAV